MVTTPSILVASGSMGPLSPCSRLAAIVGKELAIRDAHVTRISLADYELPVCSDEPDNDRAVPEKATDIARLFSAQDGILLVAPQVNGAIAPAVKNVLDWIERAAPAEHEPFRERVFALASASNGPSGGMGGLVMLRQVLEVGFGALVIPEMMSLARAGLAFDENDGLADPDQARRLVAVAEAFLSRVLQFRVWSGISPGATI